METGSRPKRVLVVDDERLITDTLVAILKSSHCDASATYSAEEALTWCGRQQPDVIITDAIMERMSGVELAMNIADTMPACKVIIMSGQLTTEDLILNAEQRGYKFPILVKPCHPLEL